MAHGDERLVGELRLGRRDDARRRLPRRVRDDVQLDDVFAFALTLETVVSGHGRARGDTRARRRSRRSPRSSRRRGFVYPSRTSTAASAPPFDYGHYGVLLKQNVKAEWQRSMVQEREDIVLLDSAIILHPQVWVASGHVGGFSDPLVDCRTCKLRFRADHLDSSACGRQAVEAPGRDARLRPDRGAPVQPDVRDVDRPGARRGLARLPAARDGAGHLRQLQERHLVAAREAAVRHRADRQELPQRDHARELPLPDARVRADGDGVLRAAGRGARSGTSTGSASAAAGTSTSACARATCASARTTPTSSRTTRAARATSSTSSRSAGRSSRGSRTAATTTSTRTPSSRARSSSGSATRSATSRT